MLISSSSAQTCSDFSPPQVQKCITMWDLSLGCQDLRPTLSPLHLGMPSMELVQGLIKGGLGAYGEKILGSSSEYVQSNISRYFSDPQYYFQVNEHYVRNKLKVVLFPFLHRGHWTRITEPVGGRLSYKPPIYDINAPDLYIPFMAFGTYVVLAGLSLGLNGNFIAVRSSSHMVAVLIVSLKVATLIPASCTAPLPLTFFLPYFCVHVQTCEFSPEAINWLFDKGLREWFGQFSPEALKLAVCQGIACLVYAGYIAQNDTPFIGWWGGTLVRHGCICWVYFHRHVFCCTWKDLTRILLLHFDAMYLPMYGNFLGEDNEESTLCRGERR
ncbi:YIP1 INTERACTING FACTOR-like protein YIF1 PROTEIN [Salix koriyanagi]|uniref:YIP1 INTERACTING FACTOR-like protein YIF1 PROTEIN n=1 Tax=Salix koriyanagi TaxID=2511006 RepID=A0A9Q0ZGP4_9ROSI|nr:YIP1 INTERACTING FACTOR-like protein YIF1 PROTEIN [Salix koriyanagi]